MKVRVCATLLMAFTTLISAMTPAQAQYGYGMYGGAQPCQGFGPAAGASDEDDEKAELLQDRIELRKEKRELQRAYRQQKKDLDEYRDSITGVLKPNWATVVLEHMDKGMNCRVCGPPVAENRTETRTESRTETRTESRTETVPPVIAQPPPPVPAPAPPANRDRSTEVVIREENRPTAPRPAPAPAPAPVPVPAPRQPEPEITTSQEPSEAIPTGIGEQPLPVLRDTPPVLTPPSKVRPKKPLSPKVKPDRGASIGSSTPNRMPAGDEVVSAAAKVTGSATAGNPVVATPPQDSFGDDFGADIGYGSNSDGSPTLCYTPPRKPYTMNAWKSVCRDGGKFSSAVCTNKYYQNGDIKTAQANSCGRSLDRYRKLVVEMQKSEERLAKIDDEIDAIGYQLKEIKIAERENRDLEADCPSGRCNDRGSTRPRKSRSPTLGEVFTAAAPALVVAGLQTGASLFLGHEANKYNRQTGNQATPYIAQSLLGYPYGSGGLYGGVYGAMNGAFGCSPSIGGGYYGPAGILGPQGYYGGAGGAFGYPPGYGPQYPTFGGGMYPPGVFPGGYPGGFPGGYPGGGGGFVGGFVGGFAGGGGFPGYGGGGGFPGYGGGGGGFPGYGGGGGGFPGYGGGGGGFPGYGGGGGGFPGYGGGGGGFPGYGGGGGGFPGYGGGGGGFPGYGGGGGGFPGYGGGGGGFPGYAGGYAGGIGGGFPGYGGGGGGFPGYGGGGGYLGGIGGGFVGQDSQVLQRQIEAQRSRLQLYQSFIQEYSSFQSKWNMYFGSGAGADLYYQSPNSGGGSGPTSGTTGRSR